MVTVSDAASEAAVPDAAIDAAVPFDLPGDRLPPTPDAGPDAGSADHSAAPADAPIDAAPEPDAAVDGVMATSCLTLDFSPATVLDPRGLAPSFYGPKLTMDGLTLLFSESANGSPFMDEDIYIATRASRDAPFGRANRADDVSSPYQDSSPFLTADGLELYFASSRPGSRGRDLWVGRRTRSTGAFATPTLVSELNSTADDELPSLTTDGLVVFFASTRAGTEDIWTASRATTHAPFGSPTRVAELSTARVESAPFVAGDGLSLLFTSDRPGGRGGLDLWQSSRSSRAGAFQAPVNIGSVNTPGNEEDPSLSADGLELFFSSGRGQGNSLIYRATRCL